jgi:hypothetical protein
MEKKTKVVIPCGYLHDPYGNHYYLLSPHPIPSDSWVTDGRQAWQAVKYNRDTGNIAGGQRTVICSTQSTVELCTLDPIIISAYDWEEIEESMSEIDEYERQVLRYDPVYEP